MFDGLPAPVREISNAQFARYQRASADDKAEHSKVKRRQPAPEKEINDEVKDADEEEAAGDKKVFADIADVVAVDLLCQCCN